MRKKAYNNIIKNHVTNQSCFLKTIFGVVYELIMNKNITKETYLRCKSQKVSFYLRLLKIES